MAVAALIVSLIAVTIAIISLVFTYRSDQREEDEAERSVRREAREEAEAAAKRQGRPIVVSRGGGSGGPTADPVRHEFEVRNGGYATITELHLWIEDEHGKTVSTPSGGQVSIGPGDPPIFTGLDVRQPLPIEQTLMVKWRDADGEHTESTGIHPPRHM